MRDKVFRKRTAKDIAQYFVVGVVLLALVLGLFFLAKRVNQDCPFENPDQCSAVHCLSIFGLIVLLPLAAFNLWCFVVNSLYLLHLIAPGDAPPSPDTKAKQQPRAAARPAGRSMDAEELLTGYDAGDRDFSRAVLRGADLQEANLSFAILRHADLRGANLREANLYGAVLAGADLSGASLLDANLEGADLERATLRKASLISTKLVGANLTRADLRGALLRGANLRDAQLHFADLRDADLSAADLTGAETRADELEFAGSLSGATLPDGTVQP